jgi:EAL domain-containing protein (putative c-di-GMP-specific phosphodiesterase class I)/CheY-like chemotaxis protein
MRSDEPAATGGRVLVVDDEDLTLKSIQRVLEHFGHDVVVARNGRDALRWLVGTSGLDVVISDIRMPEMTGMDLLRAVREHDLDLPVILMTGAPEVESAMQAIDYGAYKYIEKPLDLHLLQGSIARAIRLRRMTRLKREALALSGHTELIAGDRAGLEASFGRALQAMWMAYQPIVSARDGSVFGYEALLRSAEPSLSGPEAMIDAATRVGQLYALGRAVRSVAPGPMNEVPEAVLFVNLHPQDLADEALFARGSDLAQMAASVVLEITERASLVDVCSVREQVARLRRLGFRVAIDDLGAGYAGLSSVATLEPDVIKLDMSLVRDIDGNPIKRSIVEKMTSLAHELGMMVVAEGVESAAEREALAASGCDLLQGFLLARPGKPFPAVVGTA